LPTRDRRSLRSNPASLVTIETQCRQPSHEPDGREGVALTVREQIAARAVPFLHWNPPRHEEQPRDLHAGDLAVDDHEILVAELGHHRVEDVLEGKASA